MQADVRRDVVELANRLWFIVESERERLALPHALDRIARDEFVRFVVRNSSCFKSSDVYMPPPQHVCAERFARYVESLERGDSGDVERTPTF